ncbi:MAG: type 4a pilus biogenesis protein PilO [Phycisphaerales bacterium]|jgi:type IV pilus assembly protein PilO|nr:type 4a pilus biogenesis protein PilO [Phycisphaerales bacterium]
MRFGPRELLLLLVIVAIPVASWFLVFNPQNKRITEKKAEIEHKRELLERLRAETSRNSDLERANAETAATIRTIEARLPTNKEVDRIVRQVSTLAVDSGLQSPGLKSAKPVNAALYMEQPLEMKTSGEFEGFYGFLIDLERLPRITRIPDMKLERDSKGDGQMKCEFTLSIYFQDEAVKP